MLGLGLYYDKFCDISSSSYQTVDGSRVLVKTMLKEKTKCSFWKTSKTNNFEQTGISRQTDIEKYFAVLDSYDSFVRKGMQIEIFEYIGGEYVNIGDFMVDTINFYRDSRGVLDNIELSLISRP